MTPRITTIKFQAHGRGEIRAFQVAIAEPSTGRSECYDILAKTGREAVDIARAKYDHPNWALPRGLVEQEAA